MKNLNMLFGKTLKKVQREKLILLNKQDKNKNTN
jgi:hypothetical protein